jgi:hypothetical protein
MPIATIPRMNGLAGAVGAVVAAEVEVAAADTVVGAMVGVALAQPDRTIATNIRIERKVYFLFILHSPHEIRLKFLIYPSCKQNVDRFNCKHRTQVWLMVFGNTSFLN